MDKIAIKGLEVFAKHGVFEEENVLGQKFIVNADLYTDFKKATDTDKIDYSTHYAEVCCKINSFMKENTFSLIETVASKTAKMILCEFPFIEKVGIEIKKPWAPIGLPLKYVSVETEEKWHIVYLSIGSNLGDKKGYLDFAVKSIEDDKLCKIQKISDYFQTTPIGDVEQDVFLNACISIKTLYSPHQLLKFINKIEKEAKRERNIHWGPRTLDIDIIFYDDIVLNDESLIIPHKEAENRGFVMIPLSQIAPDFIHPVSKKTVSQIACGLTL